jgi:membrane peptidoglycan carboxypeptidase
MKLYDLVKAKTGYITPQQYEEALAQPITEPEGFADWTAYEQLQYIADSMAVYITNKDWGKE